MVLLGHFWTWGKKKKKKIQPPSTTFHLDEHGPKKGKVERDEKHTPPKKKKKNQTQKRPTRPIEICLVFGFLSLTWVGLRPGSAHFAIPRFSGGICRVFKLIPS
jgi:hypothetical protein